LCRGVFAGLKVVQRQQEYTKQGAKASRQGWFCMTDHSALFKDIHDPENLS